MFCSRSVGRSLWYWPSILYIWCGPWEQSDATVSLKINQNDSIKYRHGVGRLLRYLCGWTNDYRTREPTEGTTVTQGSCEREMWWCER